MKALLYKFFLLVVSLVITSPICYMIGKMVWVEMHRWLGVTTLHEQVAILFLCIVVSAIPPMSLYMYWDDIRKKKCSETV